MKRPEILAPVSSCEMLQAAFRAGADAVYLGIGKFNARQHANDFGTMTLADIVRECHVRGVAVHLALNTLVRQEEFPAAIAAAKDTCECGVDALIVQDLGLAAAIRAAAPGMTLHASTQCSCHTPAGVEALGKLGFSRVVLAREMSRDEIGECIGRGAEIEVFAHGALCMCVSGQCYFSAMLGGRSGNRGLCAQTCRLPFAPADKCDKAIEGKDAALSLRDLALYPYVQELAALGVDSLKIEGRRKRPEYVAAASAVYATAADGDQPDEQLKTDLQSVFSRSGFTDGYYTGRRTAMFGVRRKEDVTAATGAISRLQQLTRNERPRIAVDMTLSLIAGRPAALTVTDTDGHRVTVSGEVPAASDRPLNEERITQQLRKTGGTPYFPGNVQVVAEDGLSLPVAAINALRREALESLTAARGESQAVAWQQPLLPVGNTTERDEAWWVRLSDAGQMIDTIAHAAQVFFPLDTDPAILRAWADKTAVGVEIPRAMWGMEADIRRRLAEAKAAGAVAALCGNIGAIPLCIETGLQPVGGFGLNVTNTGTLAALSSLGVTATTLSQELTFAQMKQAWPGKIGALVYGRQPLMLVRACPRQGAVGCKGCDGKNGAIVDRMGVRFPLECHRKASVEVLNSAPLWWADKQEELPPLDFKLLHFTTETAEEVDRVLSAYWHGGPNPKQITRGLYRRGVE